MFYHLAQELLQILPETEVQRVRFNRGCKEGEEYLYTDRSADFEEPAVSVANPATGKAYLCFPNHCTCGDWTHRGPVLGTGEIELCKHQVACYVNAQFVYPLPAPAPSEAPAEALPLAA